MILTPELPNRGDDLFFASVGYRFLSIYVYTKARARSRSINKCMYVCMCYYCCCCGRLGRLGGWIVDVCLWMFVCVGGWGGGGREGGGGIYGSGMEMEMV